MRGNAPLQRYRSGVLAGKPSGRGVAPVIIIRRDEGEDPPHHGGAWKVAYADFVTAMMAFFLLMWLLNATTEEQRTGLADYFAPTNIFGRAATGSGQPFGGKMPNDPGLGVSSEGAPQVVKGPRPPQVDVEEDDPDVAALAARRNGAASGEAGEAGQAADRRPVAPDPANPARRPAPGTWAHVRGGDYAAARLLPEDKPADDGQAAAKASARAEAAADEDAQREQRALEAAGAKLTEFVRRDPALGDVAGQIMVDIMPEGLRIQIIDADRQAMFALGSASPNRRVRDLMAKVVPALAGLPNDVSITGHTDSLGYGASGRSNWDLSADRANAARRIMVEAGMPESRVRSITGNADRDLLVPSDPLSPSNRRITVVVLRHAASSAQGGAR